MVSLRITAWDEGAAWTSLAGYHSRDLERRLVRLTGHGRGEVKRLVRRLKGRECFTLPLSAAEDRFAAQSLRSLLESVGAVVEVEAAEPHYGLIRMNKDNDSGRVLGDDDAS